MALALAPAASVLGADPAKYQVKFAPSGDANLDKLLKETSSLVSLRKKLPPAPFALIGRAQTDAKEFVTVLHSLGYDAGSVTITIDGMALDNPTLVDHLTAAAANSLADVEVTVKKGPLFHLGQVDFAGLSAGFTPPATIKSGQVANAAPILAATGTLRTALQNAGYAFATVSAPAAVANLKTDKLNVTYTIDPGPRVDVGQISFAGLKRTDPDFLRRHIALHPGERFSNTSLADARDSLLGLGVFSSVTPVPQTSLDAEGRVPILFRVKPQKRHAVSLGGAYATDVGFSVSTSWEDRNLFGRAETLTLTATANGLGGTGTTAPGYDLKAVFTKPDYYARGQTLSVSLEALNESLTAYSRIAQLAGVSLSRPLTPHLTLTYGPTFVSERVTQEGVGRYYALLQFPVNLSYSTANSVLEPTRGLNASFTVTPTQPVTGGAGDFVILQGSGSVYLPVERNAWGVVAVRGIIGSIQGTTQFQVPPDQRLYAGGSGSVRGYTYQTIGPLFPDDTPEGGLSMDAINLEFRQHVTKNIGIVPFVDAGQASASSAPFTGTLRVGAGLGARYYTGIGPIRLDVAFPLTRVAGSSAFGLYVGLGESF